MLSQREDFYRLDYCKMTIVLSTLGRYENMKVPKLESVSNDLRTKKESVSSYILTEIIKRLFSQYSKYLRYVTDSNPFFKNQSVSINLRTNFLASDFLKICKIIVG